MTIQNAIRSISKNRLATYKDRFSLASDEEAFGLYIWNKKVCSVFLPVLQLLEISLRNSVHEGNIEFQRKQHLASGKSDEDAEALLDREWFKNFFSANRITYPESWNQIAVAEAALKKSNRQSDIDQIIAKLSYGFWSHLCGKAHNDTKQNSLELWPKIRDEVFPGAIRGGVHISMAEIQEVLVQVNDIRNRIAHHEPIWHSTHLYDISNFVNKLIRDFEKCVEVIGWINPSNLKAISLMESSIEFEQLCTLEAIKLYKNKGANFNAAASFDAKNWAAGLFVEERHNGVVIKKTNAITIIKSLKDKKTFVLDVRNKQVAQSALNLQLHENVNFHPYRNHGKDNKIIFLARATAKGHI